MKHAVATACFVLAGGSARLASWAVRFGDAASDVGHKLQKLQPQSSGRAEWWSTPSTTEASTEATHFSPTLTVLEGGGNADDGEIEF